MKRPIDLPQELPHLTRVEQRAIEILDEGPAQLDELCEAMGRWADRRGCTEVLLNLERRGLVKSVRLETRTFSLTDTGKCVRLAYMLAHSWWKHNAKDHMLAMRTLPKPKARIRRMEWIEWIKGAFK